MFSDISESILVVQCYLSSTLESDQSCCCMKFLMAQSVSATRETTQLFGHLSFQPGYCEAQDLQRSPLSRIQLQIELFTTLTTEEMIDELLNNEGKKNVTGQCPLNGNSSRPFEHQRSITKTFKLFHCEEFAFKFLPFKSVF